MYKKINPHSTDVPLIHAYMLAQALEETPNETMGIHVESVMSYFLQKKTFNDTQRYIEENNTTCFMCQI